VGVDTLPPILLHSGDRNRTSPMAFTGNRFEFRAVGSSQSIAGPLVALNTIMAESLDYCAAFLEAEGAAKSPEALHAAVEKLVKTVYLECKAVVFNGDGYSAEWHEEAARRGLPNLRTTAEALPILESREVTDLFEKYQVLCERETLSRYDVYAEQYAMTLNVESRLMLEMASTMIFPAAIRYQGELALSLAHLKQVGIETDANTLNRMTNLIRALQEAIRVLGEARAKDTGHDVKAMIEWGRDGIVPAMVTLRAVVDELETLVADDHWPLPTYQEMLFMK